MRKKRLQRAVGEGARQQRVRIEHHLGEGKPKELFLLFHDKDRIPVGFHGSFPLQKPRMLVRVFVLVSKERQGWFAEKNMVRPWLSWGGFFYAETPVIQPGKKQILLPNTRRQEKGGNI